MGDRTTVKLTVPTSHEQLVEEIIRDFSDSAEAVDHEDGCTGFTFDEVNYGQLDFLPELVRKGIAYDSEWSQGSDYGPGTESTRFTEEGEAITKTIYAVDHSLAVITLIDVIDRPTELVELIKKRHEDNQILPWDNQEEYGKRFLTRKLIST